MTAMRDIGAHGCRMLGYQIQVYGLVRTFSD